MNMLINWLVYLIIGIKYYVSALSDTKINCLEQYKDEIWVTLEIDPTYVSSFFFSLLMFTLIFINKIGYFDIMAIE